jgi:diguanylate cyclase (GGDEF)-like protein
MQAANAVDGYTMPFSRRALPPLRSVAAPAVVLVLGLIAIGAITLLQSRASAGRDAQLTLATVKIELNQLQGAPFKAHASTGGSPVVARKLMRTGKRRIATALAALERSSPRAPLNDIAGPLRDDYAALDRIYLLGASGVGYGKEADGLGAVAGKASGAASGLLDAASLEYDRRATRSQRQATFGSVALIVLLLGAFGFLYRRSALARSLAERLVEENARLLALSREEALHDSLTGLPNRRALMNDLSAALPRASAAKPLVLALFDLDGFKQYNDTFGHLAGDALLGRLSDRLASALDGIGTAYRMGGDEFCVVAPLGATEVEQIPRLAGAALSETGTVFSIGCSYGITQVPAEATSVVEALRLADQRMYENKTGGSSASRQSTDVLLQVLSERSPELHEHLSDVARLAGLTAEWLELPEHEVTRIKLAAELHDVGKTAIPETLLNKPGKLDEEEWAFMRGHTLTGERIIRAAPSLAHTADLVRSSHERFDGAGYPDGLAGDDIPLGASIIAVCDAFDAMVTDRPYRRAMSTADALAELRRCSGGQFHPGVAAAFCALTEELAAAPALPA